MKPEVTALPGFEELDFSHVKKPNVTNYKGTETASATLTEDFVKHVKDAKPILNVCFHFYICIHILLKSMFSLAGVPMDILV